MPGCAANGLLNQSNFGKPLPSIGLYVAAATWCCLVPMALDTICGFRSRRLWFPCSYFTLNAATLTALAIATKLPVDLNTPMPRPVEQLSKLSGTVLICAVMGNLMPSLGVMDNSASNIVALGILVLTVMVNVGIQMGTGVIYVYLPEHTLILSFMLVLLVLLISSALTVSATKKELEKQYDQIHQTLRDEAPADGNYDSDSLKEVVKRYWLMAHTSSPQYVLGRSATCTASGAFCLLSALVLIQVSVRAFASESSRFCDGTSDYRWSIFLVFLSQLLTAVVGTIAPAIRWFNAVSFRSPLARNGGPEAGRRDEFKVEMYWVDKLTQWREAPLRLQFKNRRFLKSIHSSKKHLLDLLIKLQMEVVLAAKLIRLVSVLPVTWLDRGTKLVRNLESGPSSVNGSNQELEMFVLHLEGEEDLVKLITRNERKDIERWIQKGKKQKPKHLTSLIEDHCQSGFTGVAGFDGNEVGHLVPKDKEPSHCWALPVVTLTSIAVALPGVDQVSLKSLLNGVNEGLRYVRLIEKNLEAKGLVNQRKAANILWDALYLHNCWFDSDLRRLAIQKGSIRMAIEELRELGKTAVVKEGNGWLETANPLEWPEKVLAGNCMYRLTSTILQRCDREEDAEKKLFFWLRRTISDMMGACLTNLRRAMHMECCCSRIEVMEESVRGAAFLLGEAEDIMPLLRDKVAAISCPERKVYVDDWCEKIRSCSRSSFDVGDDDDEACLTLASTSSNTMSSDLSSISSNNVSGFTCDASETSIHLPQQVPPEDIV